MSSASTMREATSASRWMFWIRPGGEFLYEFIVEVIFEGDADSVLELFGCLFGVEFSDINFQRTMSGDELFDQSVFWFGDTYQA